MGIERRIVESLSTEQDAPLSHFLPPHTRVMATNDDKYLCLPLTLPPFLLPSLPPFLRHRLQDPARAPGGNGRERGHLHAPHLPGAAENDAGHE